MELIYGVILIALLVYVMFAVHVSLARVKYKIDAPACVGHPEFERRFRIHQNTAEQLVIMIPSMLLFGTYISTTWAAGLGAAFVVGRVLYMMGYLAEPKQRVYGFGLSFLANGVLLLGALWGVGGALLR